MNLTDTTALITGASGGIREEFAVRMAERNVNLVLVINVASTAAFQPIPGMAVYAATKAFVLSFTEACGRKPAAPGCAF